jgi:hypothetical protein
MLWFAPSNHFQTVTALATELLRLSGKGRGALAAVARLLLWWTSKLFMFAVRIRRKL